jgi:hypothetical protein
VAPTFSSGPGVPPIVASVQVSRCKATALARWHYRCGSEYAPFSRQVGPRRPACAHAPPSDRRGACWPVELPPSAYCGAGCCAAAARRAAWLGRAPARVRPRDGTGQPEAASWEGRGRPGGPAAGPGVQAAVGTGHFPVKPARGRWAFFSRIRTAPKSPPIGLRRTACDCLQESARGERRFD